MSPASQLKRARSRRPQAERREEATSNILDAAERQFARHGRDGVTLRAIAVEAGVDTALVHYYFGDKDGVFRAVFARKSGIINDIRARAMDDYEARVGAALTIEGVLDVFLRPIFETVAEDPETWNDFATIVGHTSASHFGGSDIMHENFDPIVRRFIDMLMRVSPRTPHKDIYWYFHIVSASLTQALAQTGRIDVLSGGRVTSSDMLAGLDSMTAVLSCGFQAIVPAE